MKNFLKYITQLNLPMAILLLAGSVALWIPDFLIAPSMPEQDYIWIYLPHVISSLTSPLILLLTAFLACIVNAVILMALLYNCGAIREKSLMPVVFYMFLSGIVDAIHFNPVFQFGLTVFGLVLLILYDIYRNPEATEQVFVVTLLIMASAVFIPDMLFFILFLWIALFIERALSLKTWLASMIAIAVVVFYIGLFDLFYDQIFCCDDFMQLFNRHIMTFDISGTMFAKMALALVAVLLVIYYLYSRIQLNVKHIVAYDLFLETAFFVFVLILFPYIDASLYPLGVFTMSALLTHYFLGSPSVLRGVLFILCFIVQSIYYFI